MSAMQRALRRWGSRWRWKYDVQYQTLYNGAGEISARFTVPGEDTYNIGVDVPDGRKLILWSRDLMLPEGRYELDTVQAEWDTDSGTELVKSPFRDDCESEVQSTVRHGVTITGDETPLREISYDAGSSPGGSRTPGGLSDDNRFRVITQPTVLKIHKVDSGDADCSVLFAAWEEDA